MEMMKTDEREEPNPHLSIIQRLDRLERLMLFLEERHRDTAPHSAAVIDKCSKPDEERGKSLFSVLEDVHHKGTLLERVSLLEKRLIQLSIDMDLGNTSRSSSSTSAVAEKLGHGSGSLETSGLNEDTNMVMTTLQEKEDPLLTQDADSTVVEACSLNSPSCRANRRETKVMSRMGYNRKWMKWLKLGC